jgi:hypothetical protein
MKRIIMLGLLLAMALTANAATPGAASAGICLPVFAYGRYDKDAAPGLQCREKLFFPVLEGFTLFRTNTAKAHSAGEVCALVEASELSLFDGPNCESSEEHKGESEYEVAITGGEKVWFESGQFISPGVRLAILSSGGPFTLKSTLAGVKVKIECSKEDDEGHVWNEEDTGGEVLGLDLILTLFDSCTVPEPASQKCEVDEPIEFKSNSKLITISEETWDEFTPDPAGGALLEITFNSCSSSILNTTTPVDGSADGLVENSNETTKFKGGTNETLTLGGNSATLTGETKTMLANGNTLTAGP